MTKIAKACAAILLATTVRTDAQVQTSADAAWAGIAQSIPKGSPIRLTVVGRRPVRGTLHSITADALTITVDGLDRRVARADVLQVFAPSGTRRKRHADIGAALGTVAGSIVFLARRCPPRNSACTEESAAYFMSAIVMGAGIGAALPKGTAWRQIYGRPSIPPT